MKPFLDDDFLLHSDPARRLYHGAAARHPIIDYHCHLPAEQIASDHVFENLTQAWLQGDHYKWRAMRANGVDECFITGGAGDFEKFEQWAATVPLTVRNPLFHWTHLELKRTFGIDDLLDPQSARTIYDTATALLHTPEYSVPNILRRMNVEVVCTTDDPCDTLEHHRAIRQSGFEIKVLPTFRPDKFLQVANPAFDTQIRKLSDVTGTAIRSYDDLLAGLAQRVDFFDEMGCRLSDHGLERMRADRFTATEVDAILDKRLDGRDVSPVEAGVFQSAILDQLCRMYHARGWAQQFHLGALRNNNSRMLRRLGADAGFDSIGDFDQAASLAAFLDRLDSDSQLARTILYNLNPRDNEVFATMIGNFNDGSVPGKMQFGTAWWFLDQKDGMERQINALSNMGLLSRFVGMVTDSRSFLSFPRHEYFRRILCNVLGEDVERGEAPNDVEWLSEIVNGICHDNARNYFRF